MVSRRLIPPSSISGIASAARNRERLVPEVRLLERVLLEEPLAAPASSCRAAPAAASPPRTPCSGASPRKRYIGFISELPPLSCRASRVPSASSSRANSSASSVRHARPGTRRDRLTLAVTATSPPTSSRTARATWRPSRARFSSDPPHRSLRRLSAGREEAGDQVAVRHVQLEHVEPGAHQRAGGGDVRRGDPGQVLLGRGADHLHRQRARHPAGADRVHAVGAAVGDRPGVPDLAGDRGAGLVDRVGQPRQAGQGVARRPRSARRACAPPARPRGRRPWSARRRRARRRGGSRSGRRSPGRPACGPRTSPP